MRFVKLMIFVFFIGVSTSSLAQERATPADIIKKVHEAALFLSQAGDPGLETFNDRTGPWVFKDTYVFVFNCEEGVIVAHPIKAKLIGRNLMGLKDVKGNYFFAQLCDAAKRPEGGWVEYWWPKVNGKGSSRKISLLLQVRNSPYQVGAGIYDNSRSITDLEKLLY